ncbi:MAG: DUF512 domain-containing protein, partial [Candidatus Sumerlaeota bacterium]|nr:DUF512 domain-containing protein [Candidatus Sumerlaeota bacterium]
MIASSCLAQGLRVVSATPDSLAAAHGIGQGDRLISINNHPIRDLIDVRFYSACERARLEIASADIGCAKTGKSAPLRRVTIRKAFDGDLGIEVEPFRIRSCRNRCLFCFVRQQPKGLRAPLYVRDDDYRLSFLHGNYITGTNLDSEDLARIAEQRLAPLFLSVHAMDPLLRGRMLGLGRPAPIAPLMDFLSERRLAFQTQIVLCPGVNDGAALAQTLEALGGYYPHCESVAIVPAGLTRHREGLERLRRFTPRYA